MFISPELQYKEPNKKISELTVQELIDIIKTTIQYYIPQQQNNPPHIGVFYNSKNSSNNGIICNNNVDYEYYKY